MKTVLALAALIAFSGCALTPPRRPIFTLPEVDATVEMDTVWFTVPMYEQAAPDSFVTHRCLAFDPPVPVHLIDRAVLWGCPRGGTYLRPVAERSVVGLEGQRVPLSFASGGELWVLRIKTRDVWGNWSCWSNQSAVNLGPNDPDPRTPFDELNGQRP